MYVHLEFRINQLAGEKADDIARWNAELLRVVVFNLHVGLP